MENVSSKTEKNCSGCGACSSICPKKCIKMVENDRGFLMPKVDTSKCINCGICLKKCPFFTKLLPHKVKIAYAATTRNVDALKKSTSGGMFYELAKSTLSNDGIVYGCAWNSNLLVEHMRISDINNLDKIMQSKYIQSNTKKTYIQAKKDLDDNKEVLYSGTACQIAGLLSFLNKKYDKLYTIEVACHGVPAPGLFTKYKKWLEKKNKSRIIAFRFRDKEKHKTGEHFMFHVKYENKKSIYYYANFDPYYSSFLSGKILRKSCYKCMYKGIDRIADFTLADYWGIEKKYKKFPAQNGVSAILINSEKANKKFELIKSNLIYEETSIANVYKYNNSLIESCKTNPDNYNINDDDLIETLVPKKTINKILKNIIPDKLKYFIKRIR